MSNMNRKEPVLLVRILRICEAANCNIGDIVIIESADQRGA